MLDFSSIVRIEGLFEKGRDRSHYHSAELAMVVTRVKEGLERERGRERERERKRERENGKGALTVVEIHGD